MKLGYNQSNYFALTNHMAVRAKDSKLLEHKDLISQLNTTIAAQTELIQSLKKDHETDREQIQNLLAQVDYLTKKLFRSGEDGLPPIILYHYTETRARYNAVDFLDGFSDGYLETDGYQCYNNLLGIRRCSCWAHTRRYFIDAVPKGKQYDYSNPAVQTVQFCSKFFEHKRRSQNKKHTFEQRKVYRLEKEKPILDAFWRWLDEQRPSEGMSDEQLE